jgi:hypothetical protein
LRKWKFQGMSRVWSMSQEIPCPGMCLNPTDLGNDFTLEKKQRNVILLHFFVPIL